MAKANRPDHKKEKKQHSPTCWALIIFFLTIVISSAISLLSSALMQASGMLLAFVTLLLIVLLGILFDVIGVAVTSALEQPFHSMASRKVPGAAECIRLLRNADRVASICNDVIGDICGVVSGSAAATIAAQVLLRFEGTSQQLVTLGLSSLVAGLTVGGKAIGKSIAMESCTSIVFTVGKIIHWLKVFPDSLRCKKKQK